MKKWGIPAKPPLREGRRIGGRTKKFRRPAPVLLALFLGACSLEYEDSVKDSLSEEVPSSILYEVEQVEVKNGAPQAVFSAEEARAWDERGDTELFSARFIEYGEGREVITDGTADYLLIRDNHDALARGNIRAASERMGASIQTEQLEWIDETREMRGGEDEAVTLSLEEGSLLKGVGFSADLYTRSVRFSSRVEGMIEVGGEDE